LVLSAKVGRIKELRDDEMNKILLNIVCISREKAEKKRDKLEKAHGKYGHIKIFLFFLNLRMRYLMFRRDISQKVWDKSHSIEAPRI